MLMRCAGSRRGRRERHAAKILRLVTQKSAKIPQKRVEYDSGEKREREKKGVVKFHRDLDMWGAWWVPGGRGKQ